MHLADRLLGSAIKNNPAFAAAGTDANQNSQLVSVNSYQDIKHAMKEANGYNLVSSKSTKVLPLAHQTKRQGAKSNNVPA